MARLQRDLHHPTATPRTALFILLPCVTPVACGEDKGGFGDLNNCNWYYTSISLDSVVVADDDSDAAESERDRWAERGPIDVQSDYTYMLVMNVRTFRDADLFFLTADDWYDVNEETLRHDAPDARSQRTALSTDIAVCHPSDVLPPPPEGPFLLGESWSRDADGHADEKIDDPAWGTMRLTYDGSAPMMIQYTNEVGLEVTVTYTILPTE